MSLYCFQVFRFSTPLEMLVLIATYWDFWTEKLTKITFNPGDKKSAPPEEGEITRDTQRLTASLDQRSASFGIYSAPCISCHAYLGALVKPLPWVFTHTELISETKSSWLNKWVWGAQALVMMPVTGTMRDLWEAAQRHSAMLEVQAFPAFLLPGHLLYAVRDACQSLMLFILCQRLPNFLSLPSLQLLFFRDQGGPGRQQPPASLSATCFGQIPPAAEVPLIHWSLHVCPQGGGHDSHISQPTQKISIKTRIIGGSGYGAEGKSRKWVEVFVCQGEK